MPAPSPAACGNCEAPLAGPYCAQCGQPARDRIVPFRQFLRGLVRDFFSFDTRFFRTLWPLLVRPGYLTTEYVAGRRARYMPPIRLYVAMSVLFFFTAALLRLDATAVYYSPPEREADAAVPAAPPEPLPPAETVLRQDTPDDAEATQDWYQRLKGPGLQRLQNDPAAFSRLFMDRIPAMMFVLLPVFALLLKLFFVRRRVLYAQHFIFALHVHAFGFFGLFVLLALDALGLPLAPQGNDEPNLLGLAFFFAAATYLFLALRRVYGQSRRMTVLKVFLLTFSYL
ncbi:MAG: DUF3667 domain-containing protein, partial [Rhodothermales bacterium]|nr:DUF3667 domain-containing protein [Rhodothermales bacterium]